MAKEAIKNGNPGKTIEEISSTPENNKPIETDELSYPEYKKEREKIEQRRIFRSILQNQELQDSAQTNLDLFKYPGTKEKTKQDLVGVFKQELAQKIFENPEIKTHLEEKTKNKPLADKALEVQFLVMDFIHFCCDEKPQEGLTESPIAIFVQKIVEREKNKITKNYADETKTTYAVANIAKGMTKDKSDEILLGILPEPLRKHKGIILDCVKQNATPEKCITQIEKIAETPFNENDKTAFNNAFPVLRAQKNFVEFASSPQNMAVAAEQNQLNSYEAYRQYLLSTSQGQALYAAAQKAEEAFVALLKQLKTAEKETAVDETTQAEQAYVQEKVENFAEIGVTIDQTSIKRNEETGEISAKVTYQETPYDIQIDPESKTIKIYDPLNRKAPLVAVHDITDESMVDGFIESYTLSILNLKKEWPQEKLTFIQGNELARFFTALFPKLQEGEKINLRKGPSANIMPNLIHLLVHEGNQNEAIKSLTLIARKNDPTFLRAIKRPEDEFKETYPDLNSVKEKFLPEGENI